jgi:hypothetical protein
LAHRLDHAPSHDHDEQTGVVRLPKRGDRALVQTVRPGEGAVEVRGDNANVAWEVVGEPKQN